MVNVSESAVHGCQLVIHVSLKILGAWGCSADCNPGHKPLLYLYRDNITSQQAASNQFYSEHKPLLYLYRDIITIQQAASNQFYSEHKPYFICIATLSQSSRQHLISFTRNINPYFICIATISQSSRQHLISFTQNINPTLSVSRQYHNPAGNIQSVLLRT
jgi:hypothetical protein